MKKKVAQKLPHLQVIGRREYIGLPDFDVEDIVAKVDTGAYRTVIHCLSCREIEEGVTRLLEAEFDLDEKGVHRHTFEEYTMKEVRSSFGRSETRYCVRTRLRIGKKEIRTEVTLTDRSEMSCQVLIGRKTLTRRFIVDVSKNFVLGK